MIGVRHLALGLALAAGCASSTFAAQARDTGAARDGAQPVERAQESKPERAPKARAKDAKSAKQGRTPGERKVDLDAARRRWERLSPEEQARLRDRYEKLRAMGEAERRELERQRLHIERVRRDLLARLDDAERARLNALSADEREKLLDEMVADELRGQARRVEEKLPHDWRERLKQASPEDRRRFFKDFKRQVRQEWGPRALESLGAELDVPREEVEAWKALPADRQRELLLELAKRQRRREVAEHGLPRGVDPAEWERLEGLPPERFFEEAMRLRESSGWEPGRPFFGHPPEDGPDAWRDGARRFRSAARRRPEDRLEFAHLSPEQRRVQVEQHRRQRLIGAVRDSGLVAPEQLEELSRLPDDQFWKRAREWNDELGLGLGRGRGGRNGERGRPPRGPRGEGPGAGEPDHRPPPPERGGKPGNGARRDGAGDGPPPPPPPRERGRRKAGDERPQQGESPRGRGANGPRERGRRSD